MPHSPARFPPRCAPVAFVTCVIAACSGASSEPATPAASSPDGGVVAVAPGSSASPSAAPSDPNAPALPARDPKLAEMIKAALTCAKHDQYYSFESECPGFKAWDSNLDLFEGGKAADTLLSMWADPDPNVRHLALPKEIRPEYWADRAHAKALYAIALNETVNDYLRKLGTFAGRVDAEKLGLGAELKALARHPSKAFRESLAGSVLLGSQSPLAFEVEQILLQDPERDVRIQAIGVLGADGIPTVDPVCKLLAKQLVRDDELHAIAISVGVGSKCPGMREQAVAELVKRTADPTKVTELHEYASAAQLVCLHGDSPPALRKKAFDIAVRLTDPRVPKQPTMFREKAVDAMISCDPVAGDKLLPGIAKKVPELAEHIKGMKGWVEERKKAAAADKKR